VAEWKIEGRQGKMHVNKDGGEKGWGWRGVNERREMWCGIFVESESEIGGEAGGRRGVERRTRGEGGGGEEGCTGGMTTKKKFSRSTTKNPIWVDGKRERSKNPNYE